MDPLQFELLSIFQACDFEPMQTEVLLGKVKTTKRGIQVGKMMRRMVRDGLAAFDGKMWMMTRTGVMLAESSVKAATPGASARAAIRIKNLSDKLAFLDQLASNFDSIAKDLRVIRDDLARVGGE